MKRRFGIARFAGNDRGAALVEFTLVAPLLVLLGAGLAEFGLMLHQQQIITKSVRDAARYAARTSYVFKTCPLNGQPEWAQMVADTQNLALRGKLSSSAPLLISSWNSNSMVTVTHTCVAPGTLVSTAPGSNIPVITVSAAAPYAGATGFFGFLGLTTFNLTASHSQMWTGL